MPAKPTHGRIAAAGDRVAPLALLAGATVWGLIWHPYRVLGEMGISPVLAATLSYLAAFLLGLPLLWRRVRNMRPDGMLLAIGLASGGCNLGYVLATVHGEVMRVLLLFYLAPLWTVLLARLLLGEKVSAAGTAVIGLSLGGAAVMLWQPQLGLPLPVSGAEWLGLVAGFLFALANVLIRRAQGLSIEVKSMSVFAGVVLVGLAVLPFETALPPLPPAAGWGLLALLGVVLLATNLFVQYGLGRVSANRAIVLFLFELVVAALSSWLLAGEAMGVREWAGGAMIVAASLFSGRLEARAPG